MQMKKKLYKYITPFVIAGLLIFVFPQKAEAAIAFDATSESSCTSDALSPYVISWSHTVTGTNTLLVVGVSTANQDNTISSITYNSVALTLIRTDVNAGANLSSLWYLVNPSTGANTITVTFGESISTAYAAAVSLTEVNQSNPLDAENGTSADGADSITTTVTTVADNAWLVDMVTKESSVGPLVAGTNQTDRNQANCTTQDSGISSVNGKTPAGGEAMDWNDDGAVGTFDWSISAASFAPAGTATTTSAPRVSFLASTVITGDTIIR